MSLSDRRSAAAVLGALGIVVTIAVLQLIADANVVSPKDIPPILDILRTLGSQVATASLWSLVGQTLEQAMYGLAIAAVIAVPAGFAIGSVPLLWRAFRPTIEFLRPVPSVALIPLVILLYGTGIKSAVVLVAFAAIWPVLIHAIYGRREVDPVARDTARSFRLSRAAQLRHLIIPSSLPFLATGMRLGATAALIVAVTSELAIGTAGLGNSIIQAENSGNINLMYALILATGALGVAVHVILSRGEAHFLRWHPSQRARQAQ